MKKKRLFIFLLVAFVLFCGIEIKLGYDKYNMAITEKPLKDAIAELQNKENYTTYENIQDIYFKAIVAVEDRRFYKHNLFAEI